MHRLATTADGAGAIALLGPLFGDAPFELRFSLSGHSAVRALAPRGRVAPLHAESPTPAAPWSISARCGSAVGWLLAARPPVDVARAGELLLREVERRTALARQRLAEQNDAITADLLERLTHGLRTDIGSLQAVADGLVRGVFERAELPQIASELATVAGSAQRELTRARDVMSALDQERAGAAEPLQELLKTELEIAGIDVDVAGVEAERPMAFIPGAGWAACARLLGEALAGDKRLGGDEAVLTVGPHADGWAVTVGRPGPAARRVPWTRAAVGDLVVVGQIVAAAGGWVSATRAGAGDLRIRLVVPAAPSGP